MNDVCWAPPRQRIWCFSPDEQARNRGRWAKNLRSGRFRQIVGKLRDLVFGPKGEPMYAHCALGVGVQTACEIVGGDVWIAPSPAMSPATILREVFGIDEHQESLIMNRNDSQGWTFEMQGRWMEEELGVLDPEPPPAPEPPKEPPLTIPPEVEILAAKERQHRDEMAARTATLVAPF